MAPGKPVAAFDSDLSPQLAELGNRDPCLAQIIARCFSLPLRRFFNVTQGLAKTPNVSTRSRLAPVQDIAHATEAIASVNPMV